MSIDAAAIQVGIPAYDGTGEEIGTVAAVWPDVPVRAAYGPPAADQPASSPEDVGYLRIDRGRSAGHAHHHLYVPFTEIREVKPRDRIILTHTAQECEDLYPRHPWFAHRDTG